MKQRPWFAHYEKGVPYTISDHKYDALNDLFKDTLEKYADKTAFSNMGVSMTFGELDALSENFAQFLTSQLHLQKGDRIAIQLPNLLQFPVCVIGALRAGLIIVNTNPLYTAREMEHQFHDSGAKAIVILANFASKLQEIVPNLPGLRHIIITEIGDQLGGVRGMLTNLVVKHVKRMVPGYKLPHAIAYKNTIKQPEVASDLPLVSASDVAFLQYTGGTTGISKGAVLTHGNLLANAMQHQLWLKNLLVAGKEVVVTPLPLYHIFAMTVNFITFFMMGAENILITNPRDMSAFLKEMRKKPVSLFTGVNTLFNGMMNHPDFTRIDFSKLKLCIGGGMAVLRPVAERWKKLTGVLLMEGYGLTECSPVVCIHPFDGKERIGTIGIPLPDTDVVICDEQGQHLPPDTDGELCVKGPQVMKAYWNNKKETEEAFVGAYLRTGDIARMDENGFFYIVDRKKEMINVSGFNVYPKEIEDVIAQHHKVLEVGVKGVPDDKTTETPKAFVIKKDPSLTEKELKAYCKKMLTSYKVPRHIVFRTSLPKTNVGKILRKELE
ncbi:MAG: AMP-binding protein [Cyclobacteriaceae bacterium]|nr:AMP-binding protein [Cyclobacteriaceae bacterium]